MCKVALCTTIPEGEIFATLCWEAWHSVNDLDAELMRCREALVAFCETKRAAKRARIQEEETLEAAAQSDAENSW